MGPVGHAALVEVSEDEMQACVELCVTLLQENFGYTQVHTNGHGWEPKPGSEIGPGR